MAGHHDDEFHPPTSDDPDWTETCWFTFTVPERRLSGQLYPFFRPNQRVAAGGAYVWDDHGDQVWNCRYAKNFWHLPMDDQPLSDLTLPNGIRYRCVEPLTTYQLGYDDPDGDELQIDLAFTAVTAPHYLGDAHLDQPGRYQGSIVLHGETIPVDGYGFRDRSWGVRPQFGPGLTSSPAGHGGYSYATATPRDGFHSITMDFGDGCRNLHGYLLRDGDLGQARRRHPHRPRARPGDRVPPPRAPRRNRPARPGAPRRGPDPEPSRAVPQPQPLHGQLAHRMDLRRDHRLRRGPRQLECPRRTAVLPPPARPRLTVPPAVWQESSEN